MQGVTILSEHPIYRFCKCHLTHSLRNMTQLLVPYMCEKKLGNDMRLWIGAGTFNGQNNTDLCQVHVVCITDKKAFNSWEISQTNYPISIQILAMHSTIHRMKKANSKALKKNWNGCVLGIQVGTHCLNLNNSFGFWTKDSHNFVHHLLGLPLDMDCWVSTVASLQGITLSTVRCQKMTCYAW